MTQSRPKRLPVYFEPHQINLLVEVLTIICESADGLQMWELLEDLDHAALDNLSIALAKLRFMKRVSELPPRKEKQCPSAKK